MQASTHTPRVDFLQGCAVCTLTRVAAHKRWRHEYIHMRTLYASPTTIPLGQPHLEIKPHHITPHQGMLRTTRREQAGSTYGMLACLAATGTTGGRGGTANMTFVWSSTLASRLRSSGTTAGDTLAECVNLGERRCSSELQRGGHTSIMTSTVIPQPDS